jgi:hypothetical protein
MLVQELLGYFTSGAEGAAAFLTGLRPWVSGGGTSYVLELDYAQLVAHSGCQDVTMALEGAAQEALQCLSVALHEVPAGQHVALMSMSPASQQTSCTCHPYSVVTQRYGPAAEFRPTNTSRPRDPFVPALPKRLLHAPKPFCPTSATPRPLPIWVFCVLFRATPDARLPHAGCLQARAWPRGRGRAQRAWPGHRGRAQPAAATRPRARAPGQLHRFGDPHPAAQVQLHRCDRACGPVPCPFRPQPAAMCLASGPLPPVVCTQSPVVCTQSRVGLCVSAWRRQAGDGARHGGAHDARAPAGDPHGLHLVSR